VPIALLTVLKLVLLGLLYLFLWRTVRTVAADLYGDGGKRRREPPPRPEIATPAPKRNRRAPKQLVVHPPEGDPSVIDLDGGGSVRIGRAGNATVTVDDVYVSDEHAEVRLDDDGWRVRDLGSTNGTYLNGAKVTGPTAISAGDQLRLGKTRVEVRR
jgi:pSer/pThr/pTyr-binding forkhead associated (FHA) protein